MNQLEVNTELIMNCLHAFFRAWRQSNQNLFAVFASSSDSFVGLSVSFIIGFGFTTLN